MTTGNLKAIVLTLNEEEHLGDCLASMSLLTDDILVLDSGSTDRTREIAEEAGAQFVVRAFTGYASQRNAALSLAGDAAWILFLDADERVTRAGAKEIRRAFEDIRPEAAALWTPRRNLFFGREIRGGGWWPDYQPRIVRRDKVHFDEQQQVHEIPVIQGESRYLTEPLIHLNYATRREFVAKQRAYTRLRSRYRRAAGAIPRRRSYLGAPAREFHRRFIRLGGYRDGLTGLFLAGVLALEEARGCYLTRHGAPDR